MLRTIAEEVGQRQPKPGQDVLAVARRRAAVLALDRVERDAHAVDHLARVEREAGGCGRKRRTPTSSDGVALSERVPVTVIVREGPAVGCV